MTLIKKVQLMKLRYEKCMSSSVFKDPFRKINDRYLKLDNYIKQMQHDMKIKQEKEMRRFAEIVAKLDAYSPLKTLIRGYSITAKNGKIIKSKEDLAKGDIVNIRFSDGEKEAQIQ